MRRSEGIGENAEKLKAENKLKFSWKGFDGREGSGEELVPVHDLVDAAALERFPFRNGSDHPLQIDQAVLSVGEVWLDAIPDIALRDAAQTRFRCEMLLPSPGNRHFPDGSDDSQPAQAFVRQAATALQACHDVIEGERFLGAEEEAVNFPHGARKGKARRSAHKEVHALALEVIQGIRGLRSFRILHNRRILHKLPPLVKMRFLPRLEMKCNFPE